ncbi:MFS transporter, partial [Streptomyces sp. NPDC058461]
LGLAVGAVALLAGAVAAVTLPRGVLPYALAAVQVAVGAAAGLAVAPNQARVLQHAPAESAGVAGAVLQMAQRIAAAVCLSALSGVYLRMAPGGPETAYATTSALCATLLLLALPLTRTPHPPRGREEPRTTSRRTRTADPRPTHPT